MTSDPHPPGEGDRFLPERAPIDSYGNGGFRFAAMSHQGSLLILANGMHAWRPGRFSDVTKEDFAAVLSGDKRPAFLLFGTGSEMHFPSAELRKAFAEAQVALEAMTTGAAVRTYNILLAEKRDVTAALIAVEAVR
ncbi:Mth938-like domain-containing protein [Taklimakanibacter deserti]|uniref:Mth938-like domain-containing protein n=1 Tax=Taklimakanibacter deserti TaxID=2267839 RepID=UPI000E6572F0